MSIGGLSERLRLNASGKDGYRTVFNGTLREAATQLDALSARVKELEREVEAFHRHEQTLRDNGIASHTEAVVRVVDAESRATRAEQERDEAMTVIKLGLDVVAEERGWGTYQRMEGSDIYMDADAFREAARDCVLRLASGPEEGK